MKGCHPPNDGNGTIGHEKMREVHPGNFNMLAEMMLCRNYFKKKVSSFNQGYLPKVSKWYTRWTCSHFHVRGRVTVMTHCTRATQYPIALLCLSEVLEDSPCVGAFFCQLSYLNVEKIYGLRKNLKLTFYLLFFHAKLKDSIVLLNSFVFL